MPTYEFRCPDGHSFDRFYRKMSEAVLELSCPQCGKPAARQLSGGAGLVFKGSGFYLTDYGKNAHRTSGGAKANGTGSSGEKASSNGGSGASAGASSSSGESGGSAGAKAPSTSSGSTGPASGPKS